MAACTPLRRTSDPELPVAWPILSLLDRARAAVCRRNRPPIFSYSDLRRTARISQRRRLVRRHLLLDLSRDAQLRQSLAADCRRHPRVVLSVSGALPRGIRPASCTRDTYSTLRECALSHTCADLLGCRGVRARPHHELPLGSSRIRSDKQSAFYATGYIERCVRALFRDCARELSPGSRLSPPARAATAGGVHRNPRCDCIGIRIARFISGASP